MISRAESSTVGNTFGFDKLARFGPQPTKAGGAVRSVKTVSDTTELTAEQQQQISKLKQIDSKVRAHEQAHISVGAGLIRGGPTFSYETGPDQKRYAVAGEVSIDTTPGRTPEETIPKAQHIRATALAPAEPSAQDHSVAAQAGQLELQAKLALAAQRQEESDTASDVGTTAFYRGVERSAGQSSQVGSRFDSFA